MFRRIFGPAVSWSRGALLEILGGGAPPGSLNPDPISLLFFRQKHAIFHTRFQTWLLKLGISAEVNGSERQQKNW